METILTHAQGLVYILLKLMPSNAQKKSLKALLSMFLEAQGKSVPERNSIKSGNALSRFFNIYGWSTRRVLAITRKVLLEQILSSKSLGRRPTPQVIIDLSSLEKQASLKPSMD
jgi:hypothetical protein